jgi:hypothetical protein
MPEASRHLTARRWSAAEPVATVETTTISVNHGGRLDEGELFARSR